VKQPVHACRKDWRSQGNHRRWRKKQRKRPSLLTKGPFPKPKAGGKKTLILLLRSAVLRRVWSEGCDLFWCLSLCWAYLKYWNDWFTWKDWWSFLCLSNSLFSHLFQIIHCNTTLYRDVYMHVFLKH
jgi:hypothetical protein